MPDYHKTPLEPPSYLQGAARAWWAEMAAAYQGFDSEPNARSLLDAAASQLMRAEQARVEIAKEGVAVKDRFKQWREHPSLVTERAALNLHRLLCREMGLAPAESESPRLPHLHGRYSA